MIELSRHIESLLLEHNCVIVPNLGGFVAQDCSACFVAEEDLFLPPYRNVAFNPLLQHNDGLLAQSYMQAHQGSYTQTLRDIDRAVADLKERIELEGAVELHGIGTLALTPSGQYDFTPIEGGIVAPAFYGLDAVIAHPRSEKEMAKTQAHPAQKEKKDVLTLRIPKPIFRHAAVAAMAIVAYLLIAAPWATGFRNASIEATALQPLQQLWEQAQAPTSQAIPTASKAVPSPSHPTPAPATPTKASAQFAIVLASGITEAGAQRYIEQLAAQDISDVYMAKSKKMVRVLQGHYASREEAQKALNTLQQQDSSFAGTWILNLQ